MEAPIGVQQAIKGIWITIALSTLAALGNIWLKEITPGYFVAVIFAYALYCIFPYKLRKGSNPARWVYAAQAGISFLILLGGVINQTPKLDLIASIIMVPIEIFVLYRLFQQDASVWFASK